MFAIILLGAITTPFAITSPKTRDTNINTINTLLITKGELMPHLYQGFEILRCLKAHRFMTRFYL